MRSPTKTPHLLSATLLALLVVVCLGLCACSTVTIGEEEPETPVGQIVPAKLAIVHTAGMADAFAKDDARLGIAAVSQRCRDLTEQGYDVVLLDSGNTLSAAGSGDLTDGEVPVGFLNAAGYDAVAVGAGELGLGHDVLARRSSQADFTLLSANLTDATGQEPLFDASRVVELSDGRLVGIFALTQEGLADALNPYDAHDAVVEPNRMAELAQQQVADLRSKGCRLVVCLCNLGRGGEGNMTSADLAAQLYGAGVVLDVSQGTWSKESLKDASGDDVLLVSTPEGGTSATVVTWELGVLAAEPIDPATYNGADEQVDALVSQTILESEAQLRDTLTRSDMDLPVQGTSDSETALGDLVADAVLWTAQNATHGAADAAIVDAPSITYGLTKGDITRANALAACPHGITHIYTAEVRGQDLEDALEAALMSPDGYPQVAGLEVKLDKDGHGASIASVDGKRFSAKETYVVALTEGALFGQAAFAGLADDDMSNVADLGTSAGKALCSYLTHTCRPSIPTTYGKAQGRIAAPEPTPAAPAH